MTEINHSGTLFADWFMFTSENAIFECSVGRAIALSPVLREQLSVDACARTFALNDVGAVDSLRFQWKDREMDWGGSSAVLISNWRWQGLIVSI
jgi:hypothetical protein